MLSSFYRRLTPAASDAATAAVLETFLPTPLTIGPHASTAQHGGPPAALMLHCIEQVATALNFSVVSHTTLQLFRPIPVDAVMRVATSVTSKGSKVGHFHSKLTAIPTATADALSASKASGGAPAEELVAQLTAVLQRKDAVVGVPSAPAHNRDWLTPPPFEGQPFEFTNFKRAPQSYFTAVETVLAAGGPGAGSTTMWFRVKVPTVEGEPQSPSQKFLIMADSGSGVSFFVDFRKHNFSNPDFCVQFLRQPQLKEGEWIGMAAQTALDDGAGIGMVSSRLFTESATVGMATQSLTVKARM